MCAEMFSWAASPAVYEGSIAMGDLIRISGVTKHYGDDFSLRDVGLRVPRGCVTGFVGANGAGKTTTIKAILGLIAVESGTVELFGEPFSMNADGEKSRRAKERIGVVFDTCPYVGELSIKMVGRIMAASYSSWDEGLFAAYLGRFALDSKKKVKDLSRGMGMKLQLACALAHQPELLVLDEATAGLDPLARDEILDILRDYMKDERRGILMSSHITTDLEKIADTVVCIENGRVVFDVEKDEITDMAGIARCRVADYERVLASGRYASGELRAVRNAYGIDLLVGDRFAFAQWFPQIACDRATIEEYMHLVLKGEIR